MDLRTFLLWESAEKEVVVAKKMYIDVCEDLLAGILMSQIVYWHLPGQKQGAEETKLKVKKRNAETGEIEFWLAKGREDWHDEIRITAKQFDNACKKLIAKGFIEKKIFKFNGDPMVHVRVKWDVFLPEIDKELDKKDLSDLEPHGFSPLGKNEIPQTVKTKLPNGEEGNLPLGKNLNRDYNKDYDIDHKHKSHQSNPDHNETVSHFINKIFANRLKTDQIDSIHKVFNMYDPNLHLYQQVLINVESKLSSIQTNFEGYLKKCLKNEMIEKVDVPKKPIRTEIVPDHVTNEFAGKEMSLEEVEEHLKLIERMIKTNLPGSKLHEKAKMQYSIYDEKRKVLHNAKFY